MAKAKAPPTIPDIGDGQWWQCRSQRFKAQIIDTHRMGYQILAKIYYRDDQRNGGSGEWRHYTNMYVFKVVNTKEAAYRVKPRRFSEHDLTNLLYDPVRGEV